MPCMVSILEAIQTNIWIEIGVNNIYSVHHCIFGVHCFFIISFFSCINILTSHQGEEVH